MNVLDFKKMYTKILERPDIKSLFKCTKKTKKNARNPRNATAGSDVKQTDRRNRVTYGWTP